MQNVKNGFVMGLAGLTALIVTGCATTSGSTYPHMDVAEKTAANVAVHLDYLSDSAVVDCLDVSTVMGALLLNNTADLGVPRDIMLEISALNLLGWIAARDRRVSADMTKEQVMKAGVFMKKYESLEGTAKRDLLNVERLKCDSYLNGARDANLNEIRERQQLNDASNESG